MRLINCAERIPDLPNPLPLDTEDERGVVFINRTHSCSFIWYPSYGHPAIDYLDRTDDGHWSLEQWEWLDEGHDIQKSILQEYGATGVKSIDRNGDKWVLKFNDNNTINFDLFSEILDFINSEDK